MGDLMDNYEDILDPRRTGSDLGFGLQTLTGMPEYKFINCRTPKEIKEQVLQSQRLKYTIEQVAAENGVEEEVLYKEAWDILEEMGHNLNMTNLRCLAVLFAKVFRQLFHHININHSGIQKLRMKETPVVLLPTHRSYLDFLLVSYIMFHYHLPLPFIAAGTDFMHMKLVGEILRRAGAFYIRRSFGSDKLYWAIFTEYVQLNVVNSEGPLEFYIEGTRSRTGKFLPPKLGLLSVVIEPFLKAKVTDIAFVPVSISYDRILEEKLHAQEMLGVPKPKESTSGLVKARNIFKDDYGSITVHFGDPVSLRDQMTSVDRSLHNLSPRYIFSMTPDEQQTVAIVAHDLQQTQRDNIIMSAWVLCAACLLQRPNSYTLRGLCSEVTWLKDVALQYGIKVDWPAGTVAQDIVHFNLKVHHTLVKCNKDGRIALNTSLHNPQVAVNVSTKEGILTMAGVHITIAMYRNYLAASLATHSMVALAFCGLEKSTRDELFAQYQFLVKLFSEEFTSNPMTSKKRFDNVMAKFEGCGAIEVSGDHIRTTTKGERELTFLIEMMSPFLLGYWIVCRYLMSHASPPRGVSLKQTAKHIQDTTVTMIAQGKLHHYEVLSLNLLTNALSSMNLMGTLVKEKSTSGSIISWTSEAVSQVADKISEFIQVPAAMTSFDPTNEVLLSAKL